MFFYYDYILKFIRLRALQHFAALAPAHDTELNEVLGHIDKHSLLPPLLVVQQLAQNPNATLGPIKPYVVRRVARAELRRRDDARTATQLRDEITGVCVCGSERVSTMSSGF